MMIGIDWLVWFSPPPLSQKSAKPPPARCSAPTHSDDMFSFSFLLFFVASPACVRGGPVSEKGTAPPPECLGACGARGGGLCFFRCGCGTTFGRQQGIDWLMNESLRVVRRLSTRQ